MFWHTEKPEERICNKPRWIRSHITRNQVDALNPNQKKKTTLQKGKTIITLTWMDEILLHIFPVQRKMKIAAKIINKMKPLYHKIICIII